MKENVKTIPNLEENLDVIYGALYLPRLTTYLEALISSYVDAYYEVLARCTSLTSPSPEDMRLLQLLSGPINELYNPENERLNSGQRYPAVDIILNKINEYSASTTNDKSYSRSLTKANIPTLLDNNNMGFLDIAFVFGFIAVTIVFLIYVTILLLK